MGGEMFRKLAAHERVSITYPIITFKRQICSNWNKIDGLWAMAQDCPNGQNRPCSPDRNRPCQNRFHFERNRRRPESLSEPDASIRRRANCRRGRENVADVG